MKHCAIRHCEEQSDEAIPNIQRLLRSLWSLAMTVALLLPGISFARAPAPAVQATAVVVMDRNSKKILHAVNADAQWPAASLTKLATAAVTLKHARLSSLVRLRSVDEVGGARLRVADGALLSVRDALAATLIGSANNTANTLVRATGRSRAQFIKEMNAYAKSVGARQTKFVEPSGIEPGNVTTAKDMALLARAAFSDPTVRSLSQSAQYSIRVRNTGERHRIKNTNKLITNSPLIVLGGKTGLLEESDHNFVVEVRNKQWQRLIIVIFGAPSFQSAFSSAEKLAAWAWQT